MGSMKRIVASGQVFSVTTVVNEEQLKRLKKVPDLTRDAMEKAAFHWHGHILPEHFKGGAASKYGHAKRSLEVIKRGNPPLCGRTAQMKADLLSSAAAKKKGAAGVQLTMRARALTLTPVTSNPLDVFVKRGKAQKPWPNVRRELRQVTEEEARQITNIVQVNLAAALSGTD